MPPTSLLANFTPLPPEAQLAIASLPSVPAAVSILLSHFRHKPPIDVDPTKKASTIDPVRSAVEKLESALPRRQRFPTLANGNVDATHRVGHSRNR